MATQFLDRRVSRRRVKPMRGERMPQSVRGACRGRCAPRSTFHAQMDDARVQGDAARTEEDPGLRLQRMRARRGISSIQCEHV